jgi:enoyl-CoA hydratase
MDGSGVSVEIDDGVAVVTIDRPAKANALDADMHLALTTVWRTLEHGDNAAAVVLTGRGATFCAGGDRDKWPDLANDRRYRRRRLAEARELILNMLRCELPIIAAVNGPAVGVGCSMVLACDLVVMAENAYISDPHVNAGIVAGDGGAALAPEVLPLPLARQLLFTGAKLDAATARAVHFAADVVPADEVVARAVALARRLAGQPWEALRDTKRSINLALLQRIGPALDLSSTAEGSSFDTPEFRTGKVDP